MHSCTYWLSACNFVLDKCELICVWAQFSLMCVWVCVCNSIWWVQFIIYSFYHYKFCTRNAGTGFVLVYYHNNEAGILLHSQSNRSMLSIGTNQKARMVFKIPPPGFVLRKFVGEGVRVCDPFGACVCVQFVCVCVCV